MRMLILAMIISSVPFFLFAESPTFPVSTMRSTSSFSAMTTTVPAPTVYKPFTSTSPSEATLAKTSPYSPERHIRTSGGPGGGVTGGTTNQPGIATPLADACLPLMLLAVAYAVCMSLRRRKRIST